MLLSELNKLFPLDQDTMMAAKDYFASNPSGSQHGSSTEPFLELGWEHPSSGRLSDVYTHPDKPYVLKINRKYDRAFAWFVMLTKKFPNPHFPKVGNMKLVKVGRYKYYIYLIEKLEFFQSKSDIGIPTFVMNDILRNPYEANMYVQNLDSEYQKWLAARPKFLEALVIIGTNSHGYEEDLCVSNLMQRKDGTIVITDPLT